MYSSFRRFHSVNTLQAAAEMCSVHTWFEFMQPVKQDPSPVFWASAFLSTEKANSLFHDSCGSELSAAAAFA